MREAKEEAKVRARLLRARRLGEEAPSAIWLLDAIIEDSLVHRASDIHIDPLPESFTVRLRIDGELQAGYSLPRRFHDELIARCKILAGLRIDERVNGQDGRFSFSSDHRGSVDVRISLLPCHFGQNAVLRLLPDSFHYSSLRDLGMSSEDEALVQRHLEKPEGLVLVSGPTGSGKTTTLYALMRLLERRPLALLSVEDPIEYASRAVRQVEVRAHEGLSFANALRSALRQDPDVIMVGEIRDEETARLALQAALTGHLVLASIHGRSGMGALIRLQDLGIEPYLVAESLSLLIAQRLVRATCVSCAGTPPPSCVCGGSGYSGRTAVFDCIENTPIFSQKLTRGEFLTYA